MESKFTTFFAMLLCIGTNMVHCESYYSKSSSHHHIHELTEKVTHLHFYYFDIHTGQNPSAVVVAQTNETGDATKKSSAAPFGKVWAIDNPLREGPEYTSKIIGNAQGLYVSSSQDDKKVTLTMYVDFGFTSGEFNGSSISVLSRNPVTEPTRELAVVGGIGKFRMARGFAEIRTHFLNVTTGDGIIEYDVTVLHY